MEIPSGGPTDRRGGKLDPNRTPLVTTDESVSLLLDLVISLLLVYIVSSHRLPFLREVRREHFT